MSKLLTLEEAVEGVRKVVEADPGFRYPQQGDDERCKCVLIDQEETESGWEEHDPADCPWHYNDENTCLYVKDGTNQPACVLGHYFVKELGFSDLWKYEAKSPERVLDGHNYEVEPRAQRFLNTMQTSQDHGDAWEEALAGALWEAGYKNETE